MKKPKWIDCFGGCGSQVNELSSPYTGYCMECREKQDMTQSLKRLFLEKGERIYPRSGVIPVSPKIKKELEDTDMTQPKQEEWEKAYDRVPFDFWNPGRLKDFLRTEIEKAEKEAYKKGFADGSLDMINNMEKAQRITTAVLN